MQFPILKKTAIVIGAAVLAVAAWRWALPVALPFGLAALVALTAEPLVALLCRRLKLGRGPASVLGVSAALTGLLCLLVLLTTLLWKQLTGLSGTLPGLVDTAQDSLVRLETLLLQLSERAPKAIQPMLNKTVNNVLGDGSAVLDSVLQRLPAAASAVIGYTADSFLAVGTGCLAAFMLSARMPRLRAWLEGLPPDSLYGRLVPKLKRIALVLWGWLKAQAKLSGVSFLILLAGFWILRFSSAPLLALVIALVDAVPLLGTGTVLVPWALVRFLQGDSRQAVGLLAIYGAAMVTRTVLEPRLVGRQLGLDPLLTLVCLYAGYHFWGFGGMLISPILCVIIREAAAGEAE